MPRKSIHTALDALHEQLRDPSRLDETERAHLREVVQEIERALEKDADHEHVGTRLTQSIAAFEASHPTIAGALNGILQSLAKL